MYAGPSREPPTGGSWCFVGRSPPLRPRDERESLRAALRSALAVARGSGSAFSLRLAGGSNAELRLTATNESSDRWVDRILVPRYVPGEWRRSWRRSSPRASTSARTWVGYRRALPGSARGVSAETEQVLPSLVLAAETAGRGAEIGLSVRASPRRKLLDWLDRVAGRPEDRPSSAAVVRRRAPFPSESAPTVRPRADALWSAELRVGVPDGRDPRTVVGAVEAAWQNLDGEGLTLRPERRLGRPGPRFLLTEAELAALLPTWECRLPTPARPAGRVPGLAFGREASGRLVTVPIDAAEGWHAAVLGETGMGKSSLLVSLAVRLAGFGTVVLLDPLGETAKSVRLELEDRVPGLRWVAPGPGGARLNALDGLDPGVARDPSRAERRLNDLVSALRRVREGRFAGQPYWGPRLEEMLGLALRAAATLPSGTLEDAHAILARIREPVRGVPAGAELLIRDLRRRVEDRPDDAEGARRLLYEVVRNPDLRSMLCAREPTLAPGDLVPGRSVVLISGAASDVGESTAAYVLAVLLALVWARLLERGSDTKTFVILDEAQLYAHGSLVEMLRLGRRYNVHTLLATQSLASLPEDVREAVRTNVAHLVAFRGSPDDARDLARAFAGTRSDELLALPQGSAVAFVGKGETVRTIRSARLLTPDPRGRGLPPRPSGERGLADGESAGRASTERGRATAAPAAREPAAATGVRAAASAWRERLLARARAGPPGRPFRLPVRDLLGPEEANPTFLRSVGGWLGRQRAIVRTERTPEGIVWWIDGSRLELQAFPTDRSGGAGRADPPLGTEDKFLT